MCDHISYSLAAGRYRVFKVSPPVALDHGAGGGVLKVSAGGLAAPFLSACTCPRVCMSACAQYVPYGPVEEVVPYLLRRAEENSDVLGGVGKELRLLQGEIKRRMGWGRGGGAPQLV
jgi:hypothetical protein